MEQKLFICIHCKPHCTKFEKVTIFLTAIAEKNTPAVFQLSGGMIAFMIDAIGRLGKTPIINNRHEQAAGFAAEGSARISRIPGFAMGTSGPGATNLLTPIASSYFDSIPVVYITGFRLLHIEVKDPLLLRRLLSRFVLQSKYH